MRLMWFLGIFFVQISVIHCEYTIRDRIKLHKAWLERRAMMKAEDGAHNSTRNLYYFNKLKPNASQSAANIFRKHKKFRAQQNEVIIDNDTTTLVTTTQSTILNLSESMTTNPATTPLQLTSPFTNTTEIPLVYTVASNVNATTPKKDKIIKSRRKQVIWGAWHPWSVCSRTCGSGVMSQQRDCIRLLPDKNGSGNTTTVISKECIGLSKRYRLCNEQNCPDPDVDFRQLQCMEYNNHTFQGTQYEWEAYIKDDAECELNCKPVGLNYFATLNDRVVDGTSCFKPSEYLKLRRNHAGRAICVDGIC
ncbi:A disintegrin and metalloproteinase with thrombospondin motifs 7, partial [Pseudolycoriella hygida]